MKRPSNLVIAFLVAIGGIFLVYVLSRILFQVISPLETEPNLEEQNNYLLDEE